MGLEMEDVPAAAAAAAPAAAREQGVEIYPLSRYYFGARDAAAPRAAETAADRALRLKENFAAHGLRTSVHGVLLVELFDHPHVLLLQVRNSSFVLPGGRLRPGEEYVQGLKRKLSNKLSIVDDGEANAEEDEDDWQQGRLQKLEARERNANGGPHTAATARCAGGRRRRRAASWASAHLNCCMTEPQPQTKQLTSSSRRHERGGFCSTTNLTADGDAAARRGRTTGEAVLGALCGRSPRTWPSTGLTGRLGSAWGCGGDLNLRPSHFHTCPQTSVPRRNASSCS